MTPISFTSATKESRKTYQQMEQILQILIEHKEWIGSSDIANIAASINWTSPVNDKYRIAESHPYSKILCLMSTPNNSYYTPSLMVKKCKGKNMYRLARLSDYSV